MYSWYKRTNDNGQLLLTWEENTSLAGCNVGEIPRELRETINKDDSAPVGWVLPIADKWNKDDYSLIIEIKPNTEEIFMCEVDTVLGYSFNEWSPVMLRLKLLCSDTGRSEFNKDNFYSSEDPEIIYTVYYMYGSINNGQLIGTWKPAFGTLAAVLFWPEAMTFFYNQVKVLDPEFLTADVKVISNQDR